MESFFDRNHEGFDDEPPDKDDPKSEAVILATRQVATKLVKDVLKDKCGTVDETKWLFHPTNISDQTAIKLVGLIQKHGNIFNRKRKK